ncbi:MAG: SDR family NAD(P)-dependent oxidoreductase [Prevotellaceae bacterium]|jgi:NADP-dependent 3-hydroxy acid dehydrogenase YdfG|nr:SDR family NAD(P)-dependent oxidoreductase [Prevotellaceae bacterium]
MKTALVTGATAGFGRAIALRLGKLNYRVIITGRREERLEEVAATLQNIDAEVIALNFDVRDFEASRKAIESLPEKFQNIDLLVNNAGLAAGQATFDQSDLADFERMIDTNIKGLIYISKLVVPQMIARGGGQVINLSSIAGIEVYPGGNIYCATKHAVNAITKGMRLDMLDKGVKISSISPGMAETEFSLVRFNGDSQKAKNVYKGLVPLNADDIADALEFIVTRPPHVCIQDILITPSAQANTYLSVRK